MTDNKESSINLKINDYIFTDGATKNNGYKNACGGIGVYFGNKHPKNIAEIFPCDLGLTSNNRCELYAIIRALEVYFDCYRRDIKHKKRTKKNLIILSDSMYTINSLTKWIHKWKINGWKTSKKEDVKNRDLIQVLDYLLEKYRKYTDIYFKHVRAHKKAPSKKKVTDYFYWLGNDMADKLANDGCKQTCILNRSKIIDKTFKKI
jgi:ribonuclease HI